MCYLIATLVNDGFYEGLFSHYSGMLKNCDGLVLQFRAHFQRRHYMQFYVKYRRIKVAALGAI